MVVQELDGSLPTPRRVRAMKDNLEVVTIKRLEEVNCVTAIAVGIYNLHLILYPILMHL